MSINGINFKVSTVGKGQSTDAPDEGVQNQNDQIEDYFENAFDETSGAQGAGSSGSASSNPLDSYTAGDISNGQVSSDPYTNSADRLINFPPPLEEVVAGNPSAMEYLDLLAIRYEKAEESLRELIENYRMTLPNVSASEAADLQLRMDAATAAIVRCKAEGEKIDALGKQQNNVYLKEVDEMKDLNNDNWIGRPNFKGSYYLKYNDDGSITYMDPVTKRAVVNPLMDRDYQAQFTNNDNLEMISADESIMAGNDDYEDIVDLYLKLTEQALNNSSNNGDFGCPIDIGIPEYVWVKRDPDAEGELKWESDFERSESADKISIYNEWAEGPDGIHQMVPENLSDYIQVQITGVDVTSVPLSGDNSPALYNHVIEFKNGRDVVARIMVEGFETSDAFPCAVGTDDGNYVAASSVGMSLHGQNRANPLEIDAAGLKSTGRHLVENLETTLGTSAPSDPRGERAYKENIENFTKKSQTTQYFDGKNWTTGNDGVPHNWNTGDYGYDGYNDRYMSPDDVPGKNDTLRGFKSGIFISDVRGNITGTKFNDVIMTLGVNEYSDYALEHLPDERLEIMSDDPFYSNRVESVAGNDVVICGTGDNYVIGATFVDIQDSNRCDMNYIVTPGGYDTSTKGRKGPTNTKCYIDVKGGDETHIVNPDEYDPTHDSESAEESEAWEDAWNDDYYNVEIGRQHYAFVGDDDIVKEGAMDGGLNAADIKSMADDMMNDFYEELTKVPELDEEAMGASWDDIIGAKNDLDNEMNGFFDEMFGGFEGLFSDLGMDMA